MLHPKQKDRIFFQLDNFLLQYIKIFFHQFFQKFETQLNIKKIICLGESGETENVLPQSVENDVDSILLQHSFLRYNPELKKLQWKYDDQNMLGLTCKKFFLWGNSDLNYFLENFSMNCNEWTMMKLILELLF